MKQNNTNEGVRMKATPGPWIMDWATGDQYTIYQPDMPHDDTRTIAYTGDYSREVNKANAKLIAAAPDLLAALKLMCEHLDSCGRAWQTTEARAVISRAEGL